MFITQTLPKFFRGIIIYIRSCITRQAAQETRSCRWCFQWEDKNRFAEKQSSYLMKKDWKLK